MIRRPPRSPRPDTLFPHTTLVRSAVLRGAGGKAFVAGTAIDQFRSFTSGEDGIAYEKQVDAYVGQLQALPMPTVAVVEGWAVGGGLALATACDIRVATPGARFGVPLRSEERRDGKECVSTGRSRWSP